MIKGEDLAVALWSRILALAAGVLLLLARLLAAALLLAGLLTRILVLLARGLVWVALGISVVECNGAIRPALVSGNLRFRRDHCMALVWRNCGYGTPALKLALYKPFKPHSALLPHRVPAVRK